MKVNGEDGVPSIRTVKFRGRTPAFPGRLKVRRDCGSSSLEVMIGLRRSEAHLERARWYPKDGELCLARMKSGETLMEVRSDSDVQIDRLSWV